MNQLQRADDASLIKVIHIVKCERTLKLCDEILESLAKRLEASKNKESFNF
jgi:hypothetical protein